MGVGVEQTRLELDSRLQIGKSVGQFPTLESHGAAINQQRVAQDIVTRPEELHCLPIIGLGFRKSGGRAGRDRIGFPSVLAPRGLEVEDTHLAIGEAAQQVEPGEIRPKLNAAAEDDPGFRRSLRLQLADREQTPGPEVPGLLPQGGLELVDGLRPAASFVQFVPIQEMIECGGWLETVGLRSFSAGPRRVPHYREELRPAQMVGARGAGGRR